MKQSIADMAREEVESALEFAGLERLDPEDINERVELIASDALGRFIDMMRRHGKPLRGHIDATYPWSIVLIDSGTGEKVRVQFNQPVP